MYEFSQWRLPVSYFHLFSFPFLFQVSTKLLNLLLYTDTALYLNEMCACGGQKATSNVLFLCHSPPYFLRQGLSINLELTNLLD